MVMNMTVKDLKALLENLEDDSVVVVRHTTPATLFHDATARKMTLCQMRNGIYSTPQMLEASSMGFKEYSEKKTAVVIE